MAAQHRNPLVPTPPGAPHGAEGASAPAAGRLPARRAVTILLAVLVIPAALLGVLGPQLLQPRLDLLVGEQGPRMIVLSLVLLRLLRLPLLMLIAALVCAAGGLHVAAPRRSLPVALAVALLLAVTSQGPRLPLVLQSALLVLLSLAVIAAALGASGQDAPRGPVRPVAVTAVVLAALLPVTGLWAQLLRMPLRTGRWSGPLDLAATLPGTIVLAALTVALVMLVGRAPAARRRPAWAALAVVGALLVLPILTGMTLDLLAAAVGPEDLTGAPAGVLFTLKPLVRGALWLAGTAAVIVLALRTARAAGPPR